MADANGQLNSVLQNDYCWVNQEMRKGTTLEWLLASSEGGWGFNYNYDQNGNKLSPADAALVSDDRLRANSFFKLFFDYTLYSSSQGSAEAANMSVREHVLADGIPALSNAAGGPDGGSLGSALGTLGSALDMNAMKGVHTQGL